ncbi:MAG: class II SORL domain-containing protein [Sporolactobacillus sp.]|jgi:superoxide reductase|nr:class II SORL domain-containing protein [Sporolactobacillus sp.]
MVDRQQRIKIRRQKIISRRPSIISDEPQFYICSTCNNLVIGKKYSKSKTLLYCCGQEMKELNPQTSGENSELNLPILKFICDPSYNRSAIVTVGTPPHPMTSDHHIEWIYLRTAQGGQFKYLNLNQPPQVTFALAEEDAYGYCRRPVCQDCVFHCKKGFIAYAFCNKEGLWKVQY